MYCDISFFFSKNLVCDTEGHVLLPKFADILQTGNAESLKFQGNFDQFVRIPACLLRVIPFPKFEYNIVKQRKEILYSTSSIN